MDVPIIAWVVLLAGVLIMLAVDLFMHRDAHDISIREAGLWTAIWIALGLAVGGLIWWIYGSGPGIEYLTAYVVEKSLAIDNVFVWAVLFTYFAVDRRYQHRVLFFGVLGALIFRAIFIAAGSVLIARAEWILYLFGIFLVFTGIRMLRGDGEHIDPANSRTVKVFRKFVRTSDSYDEGRFFTVQNGIRMATPLLAVLVVVEVSDIIFAVDSIPAVFAVTQVPFLVFASNALAILGLRAMYFLLADAMNRFVYLQIGLSFVLMWVGAKMLLSFWIHLPTVISLGVILLILAVAITASLIKTRAEPAAFTEP